MYSQPNRQTVECFSWWRRHETVKGNEEFITDKLCCGNANSLPQDSLPLREGKHGNT